MMGNKNIKRFWRNHYVPGHAFAGAQKVTSVYTGGGSPSVATGLGSAASGSTTGVMVTEVGSTGLHALAWVGGVSGVGLRARHVMPWPADVDHGHPVYARVHWTSGSQVGEYQYGATVTVNATATITAGTRFRCTRTNTYYALKAEINRTGAGTISGFVTAEVHTAASVLALADVLVLVTADAKVTGTVVASVVTADSVTWKLWFKDRSPNNDALTATVDTPLDTVIALDECPTNTANTAAVTAPGKLVPGSVDVTALVEFELELDAAAAGLGEDVWALGVEFLYVPMIGNVAGQGTVPALPAWWV